MADIQEFKDALAASRIPDYMKGGVERYILQGIPTGDFLRNLLCNDLRGTFARADDANILAIMHYLRLLYTHAPSQAWGSRERYREWLELGGWNGLEAQYEAAAK